MKKELSQYSFEELQNEIEKRRKKKESEPKPLENPDFTPIIKHCEKYIQSIVDGSYHEDNDDKQYLFEAVMEAVYGKDIFKWVNKNTN